MDDLWRHYSNNKFDYNLQKRIFEKVERDFTKFFLKDGWMKKLDTEVEQHNYRSFPTKFIWESMVTLLRVICLSQTLSKAHSCLAAFLTIQHLMMQTKENMKKRKQLGGVVHASTKEESHPNCGRLDFALRLRDMSQYAVGYQVEQ